MDGLASPRLAGQPIFYPVPDEECATMIAREWNVKTQRRWIRGTVPSA
jgi:hypothetical protein